MYKSSLVALPMLLTGVMLWSADWPMPAGGPQRNAWAKSERLLDKNNIKQLQLLYKFKADNTALGLNALTAPIINGNLITYLGFKEMLIFGASSNKVYSVDADVNKVIWSSDFRVQSETQNTTTGSCWGGLTSPVVMLGSSSGNRRFGVRQASQVPAAPSLPARRSAYDPPLENTLSPLLPNTLSRLAALYTVTSDGFLHIVNSSTGQDLLPPVHFVPAGAKVTSLNVQDNVLYATTGAHCDGHKNALYSVDLLSKDRAVASFELPEGEFSGLGGTSIGNDGVIYVQALFSPSGSKEKPKDALLQLQAKDLKVKDYVLLGGKKPSKEAAREPGITPLVFTSKGRDLILAGGKDGRIYVLDSKSIGGADHETPLSVSDPIAQPEKKYTGNGFRGNFAGWLDATNGERWFYAPVNGLVQLKIKSSGGTTKSSQGSVVALKLDEQAGKLTLQPAWVSESILSPASPVVANGMLFLLSSGETPRLAKPNGKPYSLAEWKQLSAPAKLVVLDAGNGVELYSSGTAVPVSSHSSGLAVANGRAYFTAQDNAAYCFGILAGQSQLSEQH